MQQTMTEEERSKALKFHKIMLQWDWDMYIGSLSGQAKSTSTPTEVLTYLYSENEPECAKNIECSMREELFLRAYFHKGRPSDTLNGSERLPLPISTAPFSAKHIALLDVCLAILSNFMPKGYRFIPLLSIPAITVAAIKFLCSSYIPDVAKENALLANHSRIPTLFGAPSNSTLTNTTDSSITR